MQQIRENFTVEMIEKEARGGGDPAPGSAQEITQHGYHAPPSELTTAEGPSVVTTLSLGGSTERMTDERISMFRKPTADIESWPPGHRKRVSREELTSFKERLYKAGIDTSKWGRGGSKSVEHLWWEAFEQKGSLIIAAPGSGKLKRVTRMVKIRLVAEIFGVDHVLFSRAQFLHDGRKIERKQVPLRKVIWHDIETSDPTGYVHEFKPEYSAETCAFVEPWKEAVSRTLEQRLGLSPSWQRQHLSEEPDFYSFTVEDDVTSYGYPGLNTLYCIHAVAFRIMDPMHPGVQVLGLPEGQELATAEGDFTFNGQTDECEATIGTQLNIWAWIREALMPVTREAMGGPRDGSLRRWSQRAVSAADPTHKTMSNRNSVEQLIRRVPLPVCSLQVLRNMSLAGAAEAASGGPGSLRMLRSMSSSSIHSVSTLNLTDEPPSGVLCACMSGMQTDWAKARKIVKRIRDPKYSLQEFNEDLTAFPELNLYLLEERAVRGKKADISSGRTIGDEYQRTMGAFFAIYWMMRMDMDGKDGFTYGVNTEWAPIVIQDEADELGIRQAEKRRNFKQNAKWDFFKKLLVEAGVIEKRTSCLRGLRYKVNEKRLLSLLALTAIHDIMKMSFILPRLQEDHAPYKGYRAGDIIGDHDVALGYVMDYYPHLLPSFKGLDDMEKQSVQFTQCNLNFNHGWFVQAEGPPGIVLGQFRTLLMKEHQAKMKTQDVALYFIHWLTDLAGAEPTPLAGCDKFVTKFPLPVLNSFLQSFEFVERIACHLETEVMEDYLKMRWTDHSPFIGPLPTGEGAIAKMRLLCMGQMNASKYLAVYDQLNDDDREVLNLEMARTGCIGQHYSQNLIPRETSAIPNGPAFLVYYGPAFLQTLGNDVPVQRLSILAEVYRCARSLWPSDSSQVEVSVTVRIDIIKSLSIAEMQEVTCQGELWIVVKHNDLEAFVERSSKCHVNKMVKTGEELRIIDLACLVEYPSDGQTHRAVV